MPSSESFVTMYLAELHFGNGYMEIGLLISSLHGSIYSLYLCLPDRCRQKIHKSKKERRFIFVQFYTVCLLYSYAFSVRTGQAGRGINTPLRRNYTFGVISGILVGKKQENCRSLSLLYVTMVTCMHNACKQRCNSSFRVLVVKS